MNLRKFDVYIDDEKVAENMDMDTAIVLVKALLNEYYNDPVLKVSIKERHDDCKSECTEYKED